MSDGSEPTTADWANERVWAVVGASNDRSKFGNQIYLTLRRAGYTVYPINDHASEIEGDPAYRRLVDLPEPPAVVDIVIPPGRTIHVAKDAKAAGARCLWFQPGAEDPDAIRWAEENGLAVVRDCILVRHVDKKSV